MKSSIYQIVAILAVGLHFVPVLVVIGKKLWAALPYRLFALYWLTAAMVNLLTLMPLAVDTIELCTVVFKLLDIPLILSAIYFSTTSGAVRKFTKLMAPALLAASLVNCIIRGFTLNVLEYVLGVGLLIVTAVIIWEIIMKLQSIKLSAYVKGLLLIYAALLFIYGANAVIYIFDYLLPGKSSATDNLLMYHLSSLVALPVAIGGYLIGGKTTQQTIERRESQFGMNTPDYVKI
ncbi:hypothetical protein [Niastella sp. OAS944]|uniref:hypothetical protein n=1 Tax=Niastella sp. OAS944 TaxID=2664089 RepID=UPI0034931313|nr:hypothetical protein [Chitinophagaceae bacterium OAS944]